MEKIARSAVVSDHCAVIEIGPGIGALTQFLCEYAAKVIAFEIYERLPAVLADTLGAVSYTHLDVYKRQGKNVHTSDMR